MPTRKTEWKECEVIRDADALYDKFQSTLNERFAKEHNGIVRLVNNKNRERFRKKYLASVRKYNTVLPCP